MALGKSDKQYRNFQPKIYNPQPTVNWGKERQLSLSNQLQQAKNIDYSPYAMVGDVLGKLWASNYVNRGINKGEDTARGVLSQIRMNRYANDPNPEQTRQTADQAETLLKYNAAPAMARMTDEDIRQEIVRQLKADGRSAAQIEQVLERVNPTIASMRDEFNRLRGEEIEKGVVDSWNKGDMAGMAQNFAMMQRYDPAKAEMYAKIWSMDQNAKLAKDKMDAAERIAHIKYDGRGAGGGAGGQEMQPQIVGEHIPMSAADHEHYVNAYAKLMRLTDKDGNQYTDEMIRTQFPTIWNKVHTLDEYVPGVDVSTPDETEYFMRSARASLDRSKPPDGATQQQWEQYAQEVDATKLAMENIQKNNQYFNQFANKYGFTTMDNAGPLTLSQQIIDSNNVSLRRKSGR